ncbi:MAG: sigma-54-dependent Fis family transcriptional regulator, partial [Planctomycetes bacterium]|nr:sigma-54-dependent Fis family transcriptional regulator [Planctomycetota bacterium]
MAHILIVDDESNLREMLELILSRDQHQVQCADSGISALKILEDTSHGIQVLLTDMRMDHMDGLELIEACQKQHPDIVCIVMTAFAEWDSAVKAMKLGAYNFIRKPFDNNIVRSTIKRASNVWEQRQEHQNQNNKEHSPHIIGSSDHVQQIQQMVEQISTTDASILICGESGTGKELVAHAVHYNSLRSDGPMIRINSGALTETLLESELFGHKKGAFTGAIDDRLGMFELADKGTLFLDEVGELSLNTQVKLLRVLESGEFLPVGGSEVQHCDVRVVAATNRNLQEMVKAQTFRQDLYYRLAIITMELAPLRERREDIPLLAGHLLKRHAIRLRRGVEHFTKDAIQALTRFSWPGNIRELDNRI